MFGGAIIRNDPSAKRSETGDDYRDGLFDGAPGADPGRVGGAAPGAVEDEADYGEEGYEEGEGEDAGEGEFFFGGPEGFDEEGEGDDSYCEKRRIGLVGRLEEGERKAVRRLSKRLRMVRCAGWNYLCIRLAPLGRTIEEKSDHLLRISVVQSAANW